MGHALDINALAAEALALVDEQEKTASTEEPSTEVGLNTEIGKALKHAAELIRTRGGREVTAADLRALRGAQLETTKVAALSPLPVKNPSESGDYFRKIAQRVREEGAGQAEERVTKAAQMLNAAVAIEHLSKTAKDKEKSEIRSGAQGGALAGAAAGAAAGARVGSKTKWRGMSPRGGTTGNRFKRMATSVAGLGAIGGGVGAAAGATGGAVVGGAKRLFGKRDGDGDGKVNEGESN